MVESEFYSQVGQSVRTMREASGRSQQDVATYLGTHANTVSRWEAGAYRINLHDLWRLAHYFGCSVATFFPEPPVPEFWSTKGLVRALLTQALVQLEDLCD